MKFINYESHKACYKWMYLKSHVLVFKFDRQSLRTQNLTNVGTFGCFEPNIITMHAIHLYIYQPIIMGKSQLSDSINFPSDLRPIEFIVGAKWLHFQMKSNQTQSIPQNSNINLLQTSKHCFRQICSGNSTRFLWFS